LYEEYQSIMDLTCRERRAKARALVARLGGDRIIVSDGIVARGKEYFDQAVATGLEGVVAKKLDSRYLPGKRTDCWIKIKRQLVVPCCVIGFVPEGADDFGALIIAAAAVNGELACVGKVGSGFDRRLRARVNEHLWSHLCEKPVVSSPVKGKWVEPGLYLTVKCMEWTNTGQLRAPSVGEVYGA
jgi:bifunctional non-homologous end joining protein LigD